MAPGFVTALGTMDEARGGPALAAVLERSRQLVAASRKAIATSRDAISLSIGRAALSETRRAPCLAAANSTDCDPAVLAQRLRSALEQGVIDREVGFTAATLAGLDAGQRDELAGGRT